MNKIVIGAWLSAAVAPVLAHEGHGLPGFAHWHATDTLGWIAAAVAAGALAWWLRRK